MVGSSESKVSWFAWGSVLVIALSAAVAQAFGRFSFGVLLPAIRDDLQITNVLVGALGAVNVGAYLLGTLIVAWASSRFRLLVILRAGLAMATLGLLIAAFSMGPKTLAVGLFITGLGGAFVWIPAPLIAADAMPASMRRMAVGLMSTGIGLGIMFVSLSAASMREQSGDGAWSTVYLIQAIVAISVLAVVLVVVRHAQLTPKAAAGDSGLDVLRRMPGWLPLLFAYAAFGFMYLLVIGFLTTRLEDDSGWSTPDAALAFTLMGLAMAAGGPVCVSLANRFDVRRVLIAAFVLWPLFVSIIVTGIYIPTLCAAVGIGLLFSGLPSLITVYVVDNTSAADYGPSFSAATLAFGLAQTISPPIGGLIADLSGSFTLVLMLSAAVALIGIVACFRLPRVE